MNTTDTHNLQRLSALAGAFLACGSSLHAQVVYTDIDPDDVLDADWDLCCFEDYDINGDGQMDIRVSPRSDYNSTYTIRVQPSPGADAVGFLQMSTSGCYSSPYYWAAALGANAEIGPGADFHAGWIDMGYKAGWYGCDGGPWPGKSNRYLGFYITAAGQRHYGWMRIDVHPTCANVTVKDFAFQAKADQSIQAGDTVGICDTLLPPTVPRHKTKAQNTILYWNAISNARACQAIGTRLWPSDTTALAIVRKPWADSLVLPHHKTGPGSTWEWRVRCACSLPPGPLHLTPFSASDTFSVPALDKATIPLNALPAQLRTIPNPTAARTSVFHDEGFNKEAKLHLVNAQGQLVQEWTWPAGQRRMNLDLSKLPAGMYRLRLAGPASRHGSLSTPLQIVR